MKHHCRHSHLCRQVTINVDECVELLMLAGNFLCWHRLEKWVKQACLSLFMHVACIMKSDARWSFCQFHNCLIILEFTVIKTLDFLSRKILRPCSLKLWFLRKEKEARILLIQNTLINIFCYYYIFIQVVKRESFHWHQWFLCSLTGDDIADESILVVKNKKWKYIFEDCHCLCRSQPLWET